MSASIPTVFLAYANDAQLEQVYPEILAIRDLLHPLQSAGWSIYLAPAIDGARFVKDLQNNRKQIRIFHFAGHADSFQLHFGQGKLNRQNLGELLRPEENLVLVFLNACVTQGHVQECLDAGAKAVIATDLKIPDDKAQSFAVTFYQSFLDGQSLGQSFQDAKAAVAGEDASDWVMEVRSRDGSLHFPLDDLPSAPIYWRLHIADRAILACTLEELQGQAAEKGTQILLLPPSPPTNFTGREEDLARLTQNLETNEALLLMNGTGGVGKTALAQEYCKQRAGSYRHLCWITCNPHIQDSVVGSNLSLNLGMEFPKEADIGQRFEMIWQRLAHIEGPNLLVLDNANDAEDLLKNRRHLQQLPQWKILVTTRTQIDALPRQEIQTLPRDQAVELFEKFYSPPTEEAGQLEALLETIAYHTLSIELLAKSLQKRAPKGYTLQQMAEELAAEGILRLSQSGKILTDYQDFHRARPEAIIRSMFNLDPLPEAYQQRLIQWTLFPPTFIPFAHLRALFSIGEDQVQDVEDELEDLYLYGWLEGDEAHSEYRMHPLIQEVLYDKYAPDYASCEALVLQAKHIANHPSLPQKYPYLPYLTSISDRIKGKDPNMGSLYFYLSDIYYEIGNFPMALPWMEKAAQTFEETGQRENQSVAMERLGRLAQAQGKFEQALEWFIKDLTLTEELFQANPHSESLKNGLAISYERLGSIYQAQGKFEQALEWFIKVTDLFEELFQANPHSESLKNGLAISYERLGDIYQAQGKFEQALELFIKYNQFNEELFQANPHSESLKNGLAISYEKLGSIYQAQGKFEQALELFIKDLTLTEELFQANPHSESLKNGLAISYERLGDIYQAQGKFEQALELFQKKKGLNEELFKSNPHWEKNKEDLAISYSKLGDIYQAQGKFEQALELFIKRAQLGEELFQANPHSESLKYGLAISYEKLGDIYQAQGKFEQALELFIKETDLFEELFQANPHSFRLINGMAISYYKLGAIYQAMEQFAESKRCFLQAQDIWTQVWEQVQIPEVEKNLQAVRQKLDELGA